VLSLLALIDTNGPGTFGWGETNTHQFTVQSALHNATQNYPVAEVD
ncbi:hypothetical protein A2U01_0059138, partial [Trifolium medium]|nr:hypothetical protein [Trifolium medium]